jgi:hypothetical protein
MCFITFIIPSIGRDSLKYSINSLLLQNNIDWNAIIIFDGINKNKNIEIDDKRFIFLETNKVGNIYKNKSSAGLVRNYGLDYIKKENIITEWIGFLDDDDYLSSDYIDNLKKEINNNNYIEICIFRMAYENGYILPTKNDKNIILKHVGISFCFKYNVLKDVLFQNNAFEDYLLLKTLQFKKYKIIISSYVTYFIRTKPFNCNIFPKIFLNF